MISLAFNQIQLKEFVVYNVIQLLTSDEVDLLIYQSRECDIHEGQRYC
jgi:hypothetical protein